MKLLRSPHAHARIVGIDGGAARAIEGVVDVLTWEDAPAGRFSTGRHEIVADDPDDMRVLDRTLRFVGQRVAAVVAETEAAAEAGCAALVVEYALLAAVFDAEAAMRPGAPVLHGPGNVAAEFHGGIGDIAAGFAAAAVVHEGVYTSQRVQHAHLETHCAIGWMEDGRLHIRTSSQVPFLVRDALCRLYDLPRMQVRVSCGRVGGGFGGKQEMLVEDIVALAVLRSGRPVQLELSRREQFTATTTRHGMRVRVKAGASSDGVLTALQLEVLSDTGAYGNHAGGVLHHACDESLAVYRCANKWVDARAVFTNTVPAGAFRGYGLSQTVFAVEQAMDDLARRLGLDPATFRLRNVVRPGDALQSWQGPPGDIEIGSYGLDRCLDAVRDGLAALPATAAEAGWSVGSGMALAMINTIPPRGHHAEARLRRLGDGGFELTVGTAEFGSGSSTVQAQLVADALGVSVDRVRLVTADTDTLEHDTGAYGSTGTVVAGLAAWRAAAVLAQRPELAEAIGRADGSPRSVAFNVQGFRVAVHRGTGAVRVLDSIHAADAGVVLNPMQCRGQIEGGVAQAIGAALYEEVGIDAEGRVINDCFRNYHLPTWADLPATQVVFAESHDRFGPAGAKSMSESPFNPVAAALANAIVDATGVRLVATPFAADRIFRLVAA